MKRGIILSVVLVVIILAFSSRFSQPANATASAVIQNDSTWVDSLGYFHVFGEVKNTGDAWLRYVKITGTFYDAGMSILDVDYTFTISLYIAPDGIAPFDLREGDLAKSSQTQVYSLALEYLESDPFPVKLKVLNVGDSKNSLGWLEIVGQVENRGTSTSTYTKLIGTFYDSNGKVVYSDYTFTSPSTIQPGSKQSFKMTIANEGRSQAITRYVITAESLEYTSVPEVSWPILLIGIVLSLILVVTKFNRAYRIRQRQLFDV